MLGDVLDILAWLPRDAERTPTAQRQSRDRALGQTLDSADDQALVLAWWQALATAERQTLPGADLVRVRRLTTVALVLLGLLVGVMLAGAAFAYDGRYPVNLVPLIGVLVLIPLVLLLGSVLLMPERLPGLGWLRGALTGINVGHWATVLATHFGRGRTLELTVLGSAAGRRLTRWQFLTWAQVFSCAYFIAVLATALALVAFSDLAFGWSSTLTLAPEPVAAVLQQIALPWSAWLPAAVPDLELVRDSQFFRLETRSGVQDAARYGAWWPFVLMVLLVYGLLPRLAALALCRWRVRRALRALLLTDVEVRRLLDRLRSPLVEPGAWGGADAAGTPPPAGKPLTLTLSGGPLALLNWNDALPENADRRWCKSQLGIDAEPVAVADNAPPQALARAAGADLLAEAGTVLVAAKAWEPPLLEFLDFLESLFAELPRGSRLLVLPLGVAGGPPTVADLAVWTDRVAGLGHRAIYVAEQATGPVAAAGEDRG